MSTHRNAADFARLIQEERERQRSQENWTPSHDDAHQEGQLAKAAACYAFIAGASPAKRENEVYHRNSPEIVSSLSIVYRTWPWKWKWWKPKTRERDLIRAGALIIAELERLERLKS